MENFLKAYNWINRCEKSVTIFMETIKSTEKNQLAMLFDFSVNKIKTIITRIVIVSMVMMIDSICGISQHGNDHIWPMGYSNVYVDPDGNLTPEELEKLYRFYQFEFNEDGYKIKMTPERNLRLYGTISMYCSDQGELLFYTNGQAICDSSHQKVEGGEKIGANNIEYWNLWATFSEWPRGYIVPQGILILKWPDKDSLLILSSLYNLIEEKQDLFTYNVLAFDSEISSKIVAHDQVIKKGVFKSGKIVATRHGNGRDWWIIINSHDGTEQYIYLFDKEGIKEHKKQKIGSLHKGYDFGQACFSPNGDQYATIDMLYWDHSTLINLYDFDRCSGELSNLRSDTIENYEGDLHTGISFSPSGKYLYACNAYNLYQYETQSGDINVSKTKVAAYDGFLNDWEFWRVEIGFGVFASGPDGRLYNFSGQGSSLHIHQMDFPDEAGEACTFRQHHITVPFQSRSAPNFPNYRLGPLDGSLCDTLGLDNHPIAKYRYEPDTIDHLRIRFTDLSYFRPEAWSWDFGDGSPRVNMRHPYHSFAASGTYNVCLTVSNENSSNTSCRTITIGTSSVDDGISAVVADITLFPNPVEDYLLVTLGEYIPQYGQIMIFDISGHPVRTKRIYYGQNNVDMTGLATGMYVWKVMDGEVEIRSGKVVKI